MRNDKLRLAVMVLLLCLAFAGAALAVRPWLFRVEKGMEIRKEVTHYMEVKETIQKVSEEQQVPVPYAELLDDMRHYNMRLYTYKQRDLNCKSAYELSEFTLTDYGLPDEKFGVISIPKLDLEMPLFLGASEENMAAGAAVLSQTSIPIGGSSTNAVIAGHRSWNGYKYFLDIELLELGDYAALVDPYAEWETLSVEALSALYRFKEAEDLCDATVERYIQEHGRREPVYIRDLSNRLSASMVHRYADIRTIQLSLGTQTSGHKGGFACSYPVFQEVYRTLGRMMARYADRYFLMLCTLVDSKGNVMEDGPRLDELSLRLKETIGISIRHSDTLTRYGKGQYLILLTNTSREDCEVVRKRIDRNFLSPGQRTGVEYQINTAIICPDEILLD